MQLDYPHCRADTVCPICAKPKSEGLIMCWPCHRGFKRASRMNGDLDDYAGAREQLDRVENATHNMEGK